MKKRSDIENLENEFSQKKINHIFHYNDNFEILLKILRNGLAPSYCAEIIGDNEYYIPMISFCNIPLRDVDLYMRYGKYGIGMSLEWALKNSISPVVYIHDSTPFKNIHSKINQIHLTNFAKKMLDNKIKEKIEDIVDNFDYSEYEGTIKKINDITVPAIQFFKYWKTEYKNREIITYQEREWRFVPALENEKRLITVEDDEFELLKNKNFGNKPHLPNYALSINSIDDIRYILIKNDKQRDKVIKVLNTKFGEEIVIKSILSGKLIILNDDLIHNDF